MSLPDTLVNRMRHPNTLTLVRIAAIPVIILLMYFPNRVFSFLAALMFAVAAITDYLDGYVARRWEMVTHFGKIMDPVADKLLVSSSLIMLVFHGWAPAWIVCVIVGRELAVTGLRNIIVKRGGDVSSSWLGKFKTGFQIAAIIPLLVHFPLVGLNVQVIGAFFLWGALIFTLWSGADYFYKARHFLVDDRNGPPAAI